MPRIQFKLTLAQVLVGIFSLLVSFSDAHAGFPFVDCEQLIKTGRLRTDRGRVMPSGPHKGQPLSASSPSPAVQLLTPQERHVLPETIGDDHWVMANFVSQQGIALAAVPKVAPLKISLIQEHELHLLIRLQFPPEHKVRLWLQTLDGLLDEPKEISDVVIDFGTHRIEADERKRFALYGSIRGRYALQARLGSTWFKVRRARRDGHNVVEYDLPLSEEQRLQLLEKFAERTDEINRGELYNAFAKNCATELNVLLKIIGDSGCAETSPFNRRVQEMVSWLPRGLLWSLRKRNMSLEPRELIISPADRL